MVVYTRRAAPLGETHTAHHTENLVLPIDSRIAASVHRPNKSAHPPLTVAGLTREIDVELAGGLPVKMGAFHVHEAEESTGCTEGHSPIEIRDIGCDRQDYEHLESRFLTMQQDAVSQVLPKGTIENL